MSMFRKRPVVIEARQMTGTPAQTMAVCEWVVSKGYPWLLGNALEPSTLAAEGCEPGGAGVYIDPATGELMIRTLEGDMRVTHGDWVIRGVQGEFYPCKPDIFAETYTPTTDDDRARYEDHETFIDAEIDQPAIVINDRTGIAWLAWPSEDGEWYATRPRNEDDGPGPEGDSSRPFGPVDVAMLDYPIRVTVLP